MQHLHQVSLSVSVDIILTLFYFVDQVGWIYGSVTEDILTGFKMHCHGWRSVYCIPKRPAFKGSAPINLSDRLHQVLRWALGSVEILLSRHCPIWYGYGCGLKPLERFSYINSVVYPLTSLPLIAYCTLPAVCLLTGKFIVPEVSPTAVNLLSLFSLSPFQMRRCNCYDFLFLLQISHLMSVDFELMDCLFTISR